MDYRKGNSGMRLNIEGKIYYIDRSLLGSIHPCSCLTTDHLIGYCPFKCAQTAHFSNVASKIYETIGSQGEANTSRSNKAGAVCKALELLNDKPGDSGADDQDDESDLFNSLALLAKKLTLSKK